MQRSQTQAPTWAAEQSALSWLTTVAAAATDWPTLFLHHETQNYTGMWISCSDGKYEKLCRWVKLNQISAQSEMLGLSGTSQWCLLEGPLLPVPCWWSPWFHLHKRQNSGTKRTINLLMAAAGTVIILRIWCYNYLLALKWGEIVGETELYLQDFLYSITVTPAKGKRPATGALNTQHRHLLTIHGHLCVTGTNALATTETHASTSDAISYYSYPRM